MDLSANRPWAPELIWETPAGDTLRLLLAQLPSHISFHLTLFGSSPLQLCVEPTFTSADVDLFADATVDEVKEAVTRAKLNKGESDVYVQVCTEMNFRSSPRWRLRAFTTQVGNVKLTLPHPLDILIAKMHRAEEKDLRAFRMVIAKTGHPTEDELRRELQFSVDLYRPNFDEEMAGDITNNTRLVWQEIFGKDINVRQEIIAPALAARREGYKLDVPQRDYRAELEQLSRE